MTLIQRVDRRRRLIWLAILLLIVVATVLKLAAATSQNWIHYDENYYLNISQNFSERGGLTPYMWRMNNDTNVIAGSGSGYGIYLLVGWMKVAGISLINGRLLMIAIGLLTAGIMYFVARKWWESEIAGITALIFALIGTSPFYSFVVRMDSPGMLAYSIVLLLHIYAVRNKSRWLHFATGVTLVVSAEVHILATAYTIALTLWYLIQYIQEVITKRQIIINTNPVYFAIGGLISGIIYISIHILPDPAGYFSISRFETELPFVAANEILRYARFIVLRPLDFFLLLISLISAVYRRRVQDRHFIILTLGWMLALSLTGVPLWNHYTHHIWPILAIGIAGFIARGLQSAGKPLKWRVRLGMGLILIALAFNAGLWVGNFLPFELSVHIEDQDALKYVRETVPEDIVVMAEVHRFYYLLDYSNFMSYRDSDEYLTEQRGETMLDYWRREQPLVIIGNYRSEDPLLDQYMTEEHFREVRPQLWIAASLLEELSIDNVETT